MDRPIPGLEHAGEMEPSSHKEQAAFMGKQHKEWEFHESSDGSYYLTYVSNAGARLAENDWRWAAGDIQYDQNSERFNVSVRCDHWGYNEAADSQVIAEGISDLREAITVLTQKLKADDIIN
jgi:hypothetical protein